MTPDDEFGIRLTADGTLLTNSRNVGATFGRQHDNILRIIEPLASKLRAMGIEDWFRLTYYTDSIGRRLPCYDMTRDGWDLLVMGFTGDDMLPVKVAYIRAFRAMEESINTGQPVRVDTRALLQELKELFRNGHARANLPTRVQQEHIEEVTRQGCTCPMCRKKIIVSAFQIIKNTAGRAMAEFDHFYHVGKATLTSTWLICDEDHSDLTTGKIPRHEAEAHFRAYQKLLASRQPGLF
jgi:Rha family phage regulatory protein